MRIKQDFGIDLLDENYQNLLLDSDCNLTEKGKKTTKIVNKCKSEYCNSSVKLLDHARDFKVPEVWLHQDTEMGLVKRVGGGR